MTQTIPPSSGNTTKLDRPTVFYDGGCPLCAREIDHYRRLDHENRLYWIDISLEPEALDEHGLGFEQAMQRLHVFDSDGRWQTGVAGFILLWAQLPYYRRIAALVSGLRLQRPLEFIYGHWATWRLRSRCVDGQCGLQHE